MIPVASLLVIGAFVWPRSVYPEDVPLPIVDARAIERVQAEDAARILRTHGVLSSYLLTVGTALRTFLSLETRTATQNDADEARRALDTAVRQAAAQDGTEGLLTLRAVQVRRFMDAVEVFESTGKTSDDLLDLGGNFVERMRSVGWIEGHEVLLPADARRSAYKLMWNQTVGLDQAPEFALALDETRALYAFYISHPIADARRAGGDTFASRRKNAKTERECRDLKNAEATARASWRLEKIKKLGSIDPQYPVQLALGVAHFQSHDYPASVEDFRSFQNGHEEGPYAGLVQGYMRAAVREAELGE